FAYSATASGLRWAERTSNSCSMPRSDSSSIAACIRSRSDSEPTRMPTRGLDTHGLRARDVGAVPRAGERDRLRTAVGDRPRLFELLRDSGHPEDPAP